MEHGEPTHAGGVGVGRSPHLPAGVRLRPETAADWEFIVVLYAGVRAEEVAPVPWPEEAKQAFLRSQCELQRDHYHKHYQGAEFLIIERGSTPIGRLYLHAGAQELRVMDIALVPSERGRGLGTLIMTALLDWARARKGSVTLHVEPLNPAQRLYARLGFQLAEDRGVYHFLEWRAEIS